jgi:hypothetical protein
VRLPDWRWMKDMTDTPTIAHESGRVCQPENFTQNAEFFWETTRFP